MNRRDESLVTLLARRLIVFAIAVMSAACAGQPSASASPSTGAPIAPASLLASPVAASPNQSTSSPAADIPIRPGEPWVVFRWPLIGNGDGIWLSRPDGSGRHELLPNLAGGQASPSWSADGNQIVFAERRSSEAIWVVNVDGSNAHEVVPAVAGCCGQDHPYWSPDGSSISFMRWLGPESSLTSQVMVYRVADGSLTIAASAKAPVVLDHPRWSPDGTTFAVEVGHLTPDGADYEGAAIGLIPIATGKLRVITSFDLFAGYPNWRPDGQALVFDTYGLSYFRNTPTGQATNIFTIDADGKRLAELTHNAPGGHRSTQPFWRADGTIAFVDAEATWGPNLYLRSMTAGGELLPDPATPINAAYPRFRPGS